MQNNIKVWIESSTLSFDLNSHDEGVYLISDLDGLTSLPSIRTSAGVNAGTDGGWTSAQAFDARLISLSVVIANEDVSIVESKRRLLNSLLAQSRKETLKLHFTTEAGMEFIINVRITAVTGALTNILKKQELLIQMRADDPIIYGAQGGEGADATLLVQQTQSGFEIPFDIPLLIGGGSGKVDVEDLGTEEVYPIIKMTGPLHNPTVVNETQNAEIGINADLGDMEWRGYKSVKLLGNAEQETYTGKNLINTNALGRTLPYSITSRGVSFVVAEDGSITINGKNDGTGNSSVHLYNNTTPLVLQGGTYTGDINPSDGVYRNATLQVYDGSHYRPFKENSHFTIEAGNCTAYIQVANGETTQFSNYKIYPMLEAGSTKSPYEPFVGSIDGALTPSPNPSYPQEIKTVSGGQTVNIAGKNLWGGLRSTYSTTSANVDFTTYPDGSVYAKGTSTAVASSSNSSTALQNGLYITIPSGTYTVSGTNPDMPLQAFNVITGDILAYSGHPTFTLNETTSIFVRVRLASGITVDGTTNIMVEKSATPTSYEPYQGHNYEINLGKNLFDIKGFLDARSATYTEASDGTLTITGIGALYTSPLKFSDEDTTVSLQGIIANLTASNVRIQLLNSASTVVGEISSSTQTVRNIKASSLRFNWTSTGTFTVKNAQLEAGTLTTSYSPYKTPLELAEIGNYTDGIYPSDGKWYIHKEVGKVVLDGGPTEAWSYYGPSNQRFTHNINNIAIVPSDTDKGAIMCDYFTTMPIRSIYTGANYGIGVHNVSHQIWVSYQSFTSTAQFKTWLQSHPTTVYYALATPTDTEITDAELVEQLDALLNYAPWYGDDQNVFLIPSAGADGTLVLGAHNEPKPADEVLIDTHLKTVTLNGQNAYPLLKDGSSFFSLAPGDNIMYLTSDVSSDTGKAEIKFKQGFISI